MCQNQLLQLVQEVLKILMFKLLWKIWVVVVHFSMAAAQFENQSIEDVRLLLEEKIKEYLDDRGEV